MTNGDMLVTGAGGAKGIIIMATDYSNGNDQIVAKPGRIVKGFLCEAHAIEGAKRHHRIRQLGSLAHRIRLPCREGFHRGRVVLATKVKVSHFKQQKFECKNSKDLARGRTLT
jgi:hypothetical protein